MIRRKPFETASNATAAQRNAIEPLCQCFTRRTRSRKAEWPLSIRFVVPRHRRSSLGKPRRLIVNISSSPSLNEPAALGQSRSSHVAYFWSWAVPSLASSLNAALSIERAQGGRQEVGVREVGVRPGFWFIRGG